jgi:hypothetical protein
LLGGAKLTLKILDTLARCKTGKECLFQLPIFLEYPCLNENTLNDEGLNTSGFILELGNLAEPTVGASNFD